LGARLELLKQGVLKNPDLNWRLGVSVFQDIGFGFSVGLGFRLQGDKM
jgi:hypothetical protein